MFLIETFFKDFKDGYWGEEYKLSLAIDQILSLEPMGMVVNPNNPSETSHITIITLKQEIHIHGINTSVSILLLKGNYDDICKKISI